MDTHKRDMRGPYAAALLGTQVPVAILAALAALLIAGDGPGYYVFAELVPAVLYIFLAVLPMRRHGGPWSYGLAPARARDCALGVLAVLALYPTSMVLAGISAALFPHSTGGDASHTAAALGPALSALTLAVAPAAMEECLCRGFLYGTCRGLGARRAAFVSALCFAALHGNMRQAAYALPMGLVFAAMAEKTGSILPCAAGHMAFNMVPVLQLALPGLFPESLPAVLVLGAAPFGALLGLLALRAMGRGTDGPRELPPPCRHGWIWAASGTALNLLLYLLVLGTG